MDFREIYKKMWLGFVQRNPRSLRKLHKKILRDASLSTSHKLFELAVLSYALSKIVSKTRFQRRALSKQMKEIENALARLSRIRDDRAWKKEVEKIKDLIVGLDEQDKRYLLGLLEKGAVKVASTLHAQGFSLGQAAKLTGTTKQELLAYVGKTTMFERIKPEIDVIKRYFAFKRYAEG